MRKLAIFSAAFAIATAVFVYWLQDVRALWLAGAGLLMSVLGRMLGLRRLSIAALGVTFGVLWCFVYRSVKISPLEKLAGSDRTVTIAVTELPRQTTYGASVEGVLEHAGVVLYGDESLLKTRPGDQVTVTGELAMTGLEIWNDESLYLRSKGVDLCVFAKSEPEIVLGSPTLPQRIRIWLQNKISLLYDGDAEGLLRALVTGDRSGLSYSTQNQLSVAGLSHAVAVSGMHVSMLLMLVSLLCGGSPYLRAWIGIPIVILFALTTGASPSVCRAAIMQIFFLAAPLLRREQDSVTTLGAAALVLLLENPWSIASVSFQLSFAAVAGLFLFSGPIQNKLLSRQKHPSRIWQFVVSSIAASFSATITTMPLCIYYFRIVSIAAPLTNLLTLWAVTGVFSLGLLSCLLGPIGNLLVWVVELLSAYILGVCRWIAQWCFAAAYPENLPLMIWAVCAYVLAVVLLIPKKKLPVLWCLSGLTAAFLVCILTANWQFNRQSWRLTALDVGQGQCLLLQIGDYTAAIDCGGTYPEDAGETLSRTLHSAGVTQIDTLILTHYDLDHAGGALQLLDRVQVDSLFLPAVEDLTGVKAALEQTDSEIFYVENLTEITVPEGEIRLYPPVSLENDNNSGVCVLATSAEYDILVTGDLDQFAEMRLLSRWELPDVDLLVAGHHGAKSATSQTLLEYVRPEKVLISVGSDNPYGHPAEETLQRITAAGAEILRTDQLGTITIHP